MGKRERATSGLSFAILSQPRIALEFLDDLIPRLVPREAGPIALQEKWRIFVRSVHYAVESKVGQRVLSRERAQGIKESLSPIVGVITDETGALLPDLPDQVDGIAIGPFLLSMIELFFFHVHFQAELVGHPESVIHMTPASYEGMIAFMRARDDSHVSFLRELYVKLVNNYLSDEEVDDLVLGGGDRTAESIWRRIRPVAAWAVENLQGMSDEELLARLFVIAHHQRCPLIAEQMFRRLLALGEPQPHIEALIRRGMYFTPLGTG